MKTRLLPLICLFLLIPALPAQDESARESAQTIINRIERRPDRVWDYAFALRDMTRNEASRASLVALFEEKLAAENEHVRLVCARLVLAVGRAELAYDALGGLLQSRDGDVVEAVAMMITAEVPDDEELIERLRMRWEDSANLAPGARVALAEALYVSERDDLALEQLREFLTSTNHELMARAALVLSQRGHANLVGGRITSLGREPGDMGRLARISSEINRTEKAIEEVRAGQARRPDRLVAAQLRQVRDHYVDDFLIHGDKQIPLNNESLVDAAGRGMAGATDQYGEFMSRADFDEMQQEQQGHYVGIGAHVSQREDGAIIVDRPIYEGPAYAAGLRSGDMLVAAIDQNKRLDLTKMSLQEAVNYIRGPEGSKVVIFVRRRGVEEELSFEIERRSVHLNSALHEMMPGGVGYLRLTRFGQNSDKDFQAAMDNLLREGMEYLVLDLRGNGGGQLRTVLGIANMLLERGLPISSTGGRWGDFAQRRVFHSEGGPYAGIPMVCLIDEGSASGSEMLSGALRDNNRALLIGRPSFGKGTGQSFFTVNNSGGSRILKVTVFSYYLPSGVSIDRFAGEGGVAPNIDVRPDLLEPWQVYALEHLRKSERIEGYLDRHYRGEGLAALMRLAVFDELDHTRWPGFEEFYQSLNTRLARDDVRREVRFALRRRVQDDRGAEFTQNFQEDQTLLRGVRELFRAAEKDPKSVAEYRAVMKD